MMESPRVSPTSEEAQVMAGLREPLFPLKPRREGAVGVVHVHEAAVGQGANVHAICSGDGGECVVPGSPHLGAVAGGLRGRSPAGHRRCHTTPGRWQSWWRGSASPAAPPGSSGTGPSALSAQAGELCTACSPRRSARASIACRSLASYSAIWGSSNWPGRTRRTMAAGPVAPVARAVRRATAGRPAPRTSSAPR